MKSMIIETASGPGGMTSSFRLSSALQHFRVSWLSLSLSAPVMSAVRAQVKACVYVFDDWSVIRRSAGRLRSAGHIPPRRRITDDSKSRVFAIIPIGALATFDYQT
jgi:hypothetical protein